MYLIKETVAREIEALQRGFVPTAEQVDAFGKALAAAPGMPTNLRIAGNDAEIVVEGVLTKRRELFYAYWGGGSCTYNDIRAALALAESDPTVKRAVLRVDSPGGQVAGLLETINAIEAFSKPIVARCTMACSAAYALAAACDRIEAENDASEFGCLGVAVTYLYWANETEVTLTNTDSPEKRPDPRTEEGRASIVRYLDATNEWFIKAIARGRETKPEAVTENYGRGATLLAADAKRRGMIDGYVAQRQGSSSSGARAESEERPMAEQQTWNNKPYRDLTAPERAQLKKQDPALYKSMREADANDWVRGRAFKDLPPLARAKLKQQDPELYAKLSQQS